MISEELDKWEFKFRPYRWLFICVLCMVAYNVAGWDTVILVLLASCDIETKENK